MGAVDIPAELLHRPPSDEIAVFYGWLADRRAWCAVRGLSYLDTFHPRDPTTGQRVWRV